MDMPVMGVGPVNVCMGKSFMHMDMVMWLCIVFLIMRMMVMFIMIMRVLVPMCNSFMDMGMLVRFSVQTKDARDHQHSGEPEKCGRLLMKQNQ